MKIEFNRFNLGVFAAVILAVLVAVLFLLFRAPSQEKVPLSAGKKSDFTASEPKPAPSAPQPFPSSAFMTEESESAESATTADYPEETGFLEEPASESQVLQTGSFPPAGGSLVINPPPEVDVIPATSEKEIFDKLFPKSYIDTVAYFQDLLTNAGYVKTTERVILDNIDNVITALDKGLKYLLTDGRINQQRYTELNDGLHNAFRNLITWEYEELKKPEHLRFKEIPTDIQKYFQSQKDNPMKLASVFSESSCVLKPKGLLGSILVLVRNFLGSNVNAQYVCAEGVECYRGVVLAGPVGVNLWAPCCCCFAGGKSPVPIGCLNAVCPSGNAIWDSATGICGCG